MRPMTVVAWLRLLACQALVGARLLGGDAPAPAPAGTDAPAADHPAAASPLSDDDKWVFAPVPNRPDVFYDYEQWLILEKHIQQAARDTPTTTGSGQAVTTDDPLEFAKQAINRIDAFINERKWEDAEKVAEQAIKKLSGVVATPEVTKYLQVLKAYLEQVQDARLRDEAEASFDALNLKVEGILWAETGPRLALISNEPRALGINDRVKDCVIINIDTDRVDFRYHYKRKRFEFPRYVGEESKTK